MKNIVQYQYTAIREAKMQANNNDDKDWETEPLIHYWQKYKMVIWKVHQFPDKLNTHLSYVKWYFW